MNKKELLATATFVTLYTGFIFTGFSWMLSSKTDPIKENQARMEKRMDRIEHRMDRMETEQKDIKERIIRIESMLGQILIAQNIHHKGKASPTNKFKKARKTKTNNRKTASH